MGGLLKKSLALLLLLAFEECIHSFLVLSRHYSREECSRESAMKTHLKVGRYATFMMSFQSKM